jgi:hypothetical protein
MVSPCLLVRTWLLLGAGSRLRAAAGALFPPKGEEKKSEFEAESHLGKA